MDFIISLLVLKNYTNIVIITNRLSKGVIANNLENIKAKIITKWFLQKYYPYYFLLFTIISNKGAQFIGAF